MFLKQEKFEIDDFEEEKNLVLKEKYFDKFLFIMFLYILIYFLMSKFFNEYPCKNGTKYFCIFLCFRTSF